MLRWFDGERNLRLSDMPHRGQYEEWRSRLTAGELNAALAFIERLIQKDTIHTSSWMPGPNWSDTPLHAIYEKATRMSEQ